MAVRARIRKPEALVEALSLFAFVMLFIWKLRPSYPGLALLAPAFTIATHAARGETARQLGFGWREFRGALPVLLWAGAFASLVLAAGALAGTMRAITLNHAAWDLGAYMVWGFLQQYLLNGFLANRLAESTGNPGSRPVALAAATLFSLAHLPNRFLMVVTLIGGYLSVRVYQRSRSLYVLGVVHATIALALFLAVPDSISGRFYVGPRYLIDGHAGYLRTLP